MANTSFASALLGSSCHAGISPHGSNTTTKPAGTNEAQDASAPYMQDLVGALGLGLGRKNSADTVQLGAWLARATALYVALVEQSDPSGEGLGSISGANGNYPIGCFANTAPVDRFRLFSGTVLRRERFQSWCWLRERTCNRCHPYVGDTLR